MNLDDDCVDPSTICKEYNSKLTLREQLKLVSIIANLFWKHHVCTSGNEANDLATTLFMTLLDIGLAEEAYRIAFEFELNISAHMIRMSDLSQHEKSGHHLSIRGAAAVNLSTQSAREWLRTSSKPVYLPISDKQEIVEQRFYTTNTMIAQHVSLRGRVAVIMFQSAALLEEACNVGLVEASCRIFTTIFSNLKDLRRRMRLDPCKAGTYYIALRASGDKHHPPFRIGNLEVVWTTLEKQCSFFVERRFLCWCYGQALSHEDDTQCT